MNKRDREARFRIEAKPWSAEEGAYFLYGREIFDLAGLLMDSHGFELPRKASLRKCMKVMVEIQNLEYVKTYRLYQHCIGRSCHDAVASPLIERGSEELS